MSETQRWFNDDYATRVATNRFNADYDAWQNYLNDRSDDDFYSGEYEDFETHRRARR